jgi:hypothetical protein
MEWYCEGRDTCIDSVSHGACGALAPSIVCTMHAFMLCAFVSLWQDFSTESLEVASKDGRSKVEGRPRVRRTPSEKRR